MHKYSFVLILFLLAVVTACVEDGSDEHKPFDKKGPKPEQVTNLDVLPLNGGARISYDLPTSKDLLYVKAVYTRTSGEEVSVVSSIYNNFLTIEGMGDTLEYSVNIYAVTRSGVESDPVEVRFTPLEPYVWNVFNSMSVASTFGGINLRAKNDFEEEIAILIMLRDEIFGRWEPISRSLYTQVKDIDYFVRGYDTLEYEFAFVVRDKFQNYSDTLVRTVKPLFEELVAKPYQQVNLPSDAPKNPGTTNPNALWGGDPSAVGYGSSVLLTLAEHTPGVPHLYTFQLRKKAKISRMVTYDYPEYGDEGQIYYFTNGAPRILEIYASPYAGSDVSDDLNDSTWLFVGRFEEIKPSGNTPQWTVTTEDVETARAGFNWDFPADLPPLQTIRIKCVENWNGLTHMALAEVSVYGNTNYEEENE